jgi:hypothetical protein
MRVRNSAADRRRGVAREEQRAERQLADVQVDAQLLAREAPQFDGFG